MTWGSNNGSNKDPVILVDSSYYAETIQVPITSKPLPALLAPPIPEASLSCSSFSSSISSLISTVTTTTTNAAVDAVITTTTTPKQHSRKCSNKSNISSPSSSPFIPLSNNNAITNGSNYYTIIQKQSQEIQELRRELIKLNQKYIDKLGQVQVAEEAKYQVESELEELSLKLFEQANEMVSKEKKARYLADKKTVQLEKELTMVYEQLEDERAQLAELKDKWCLQDQQQQQQPISIFIQHPEEESSESSDESTMCSSISSSMIPASGLLSPAIGNEPMYSTNVYLDQGWLSLFKDFLETAPKTPLESIHKLPFLKKCFELDVEPCLRFNRSLPQKRVLDAIIHQPCYIELDSSSVRLEKRHSHDDRSMASVRPPVRRSSFPFGALKFNKLSSSEEETPESCHGCGAYIKQSRQDIFRFKLKETDVEWSLIDQNCRDRLVSVCDFYVFIRHVRLGLQNQKTIQSLFQECVWLRLCMFWARSGIHHYGQRDFIATQ